MWKLWPKWNPVWRKRREWIPWWLTIWWVMWEFLSRLFGVKKSSLSCVFGRKGKKLSNIDDCVEYVKKKFDVN